MVMIKVRSKTFYCVNTVRELYADLTKNRDCKNVWGNGGKAPDFLKEVSLDDAVKRSDRITCE
jgi:hypothetical protein